MKTEENPPRGRVHGLCKGLTISIQLIWYRLYWIKSRYVLATVGNKKGPEGSPRPLISLVAGSGFEPETFGL